MQRRSFFILPLLMLFTLCRADAPPIRFRSPHGKFEFAFETPNPLASVDPDKPSATQGLKARKYRISFYTPGSGTDVATTDFYDIRPSSSDGEPTALTELAKQMLWSPDEDFVILPQEQWPTPQAAAAATPPRLEGRTAVSLNTGFPWMTSSFTLDPESLIWVNATQVVGNLRLGCELSVSKFDARTGKIVSIARAASPAGYTLLSGDKDQILMKKVLSSCASADDAKMFVAECTYLDLPFDRRHIGQCPK